MIMTWVHAVREWRGRCRLVEAEDVPAVILATASVLGCTVILQEDQTKRTRRCQLQQLLFQLTPDACNEYNEDRGVRDNGDNGDRGVRSGEVSISGNLETGHFGRNMVQLCMSVHLWYTYLRDGTRICDFFIKKIERQLKITFI